jgi:ribosomal protein L1
MFKQLCGQVRWRRYRPFSVPKRVSRKATDSGSSVTVKSGSVEPSVSTIDSPAESLASELFKVGPLQAMRLLTAFGGNQSSVSSRNIPYLSLSLKLDVDVKRQSVRGVCHLPHGLRTNMKLLVFCSDFDAQEMIAAGADFAGMNDLLQRIGKGWTGFDRCIATPAVMPQVMKVAKILGPKKLMPNPKSGTLVTDLKRAIIESKSGAQLEYRTRETEPLVDVVLGSLDAPLQANLDNIKFIVREILKHKSRQSGGDDGGASVGRLVSTGGISMLPNIDKLNRLLQEKATAAAVASSGSTKKKGLFIQEAFIRSTIDPDVVIELDPELILPSSPAYYR